MACAAHATKYAHAAVVVMWPVPWGVLWLMQCSAFQAITPPAMSKTSIAGVVGSEAEDGALCPASGVVDPEAAGFTPSCVDVSGSWSSGSALAGAVAV